MHPFFQIDRVSRFHRFFSGVLCLSLSMTAQLEAQKYSNEFLAIGTGARAQAMGNNVVASVQDVYAGFWNPANLSRLQVPLQVGAMHAEWFAGIARYDCISAAKTLNPERGSVAGATLIRMGVDNIPYTINLVGPDGSINYNNVSEFSTADYGILLSYAQPFKNKDWSLGGNVKIIRRVVGQIGNAWGFGLDAGISYRRGSWSFSAVGRDITSTFNAWSFTLNEQEKQVFTATGNAIPKSSVEITRPSLILGASKTIPFKNRISLLAEFNARITTDGKRNTLVSGDPFSIDPGLGLELNYRNFLFLRGGVNNFQYFTEIGDPTQKTLSLQPNLGLGLQLGRFNIDYAYTNFGNVSAVLYSHIFSLTLHFEKPKSVKDLNSEN